MQRYVVLERYTDQGIQDFRSSPTTRIEEARETAAKAGARIRDVFWTIGPYDIVSVMEAPNDAAIQTVLLSDASKGNVRPMIMRAFSQEEMKAIVADSEQLK